MHDLFPKGKDRDVGDLNIVPILDMFVCVIFFLLLGTSFTELTKLTLPPSAVSTSQNPVATPPLSPKLVGLARGDTMHLILSWEGPTPGKVEQDVSTVPMERDVAETNASEAKLRAAVAKMIGDFNTQHPAEKVLKVGLGSSVAYQHLVSVMDGARDKMPDLVLFSYVEAESLRQ